MLPAELTRQRAKMIILANPNNPTATLVPVDALRALCDEARGRDRRRRRGLRRLRAGRRARRQHAALPRPAREPGRAAHDVQELQPGRRAPRPAVRRRADRRGADQGQGQLQRQRRHPGDRHRRARRPRLPRRLRAPHARPSARGSKRRWRRLGLTWPESAANFLLVEIGARAEEIYLALKQKGLLVRWWSAPELRTKLRISVGKPADNDRLIAG